MDDIIKRVSDTVTDQPVIITVDIKDRSWMDKLLKRNPVKIFEVKQITLGNLIRISKLLRGIDVGEFNKISQQNILDSNFNLMEQYGHTLAEIVATALHNKKDPPEQHLVAFIENNFTARELLNVLSVVLRQMDVASFMSTIISIKGLSILENPGANVTNANGKEVSR